MPETRNSLWENGAEIASLYSEAPFGLALISEDLRYIRINPFLARLNGIPVARGCRFVVVEAGPRRHGRLPGSRPGSRRRIG